MSRSSKYMKKMGKIHSTEWSNSFMHPFCKHLLSSYFVSGTVTGSRDTAVKRKTLVVGTLLPSSQLLFSQSFSLNPTLTRLCANHTQCPHTISFIESRNHGSFYLAILLCLAQSISVSMCVCAVSVCLCVYVRCAGSGEVVWG